MDVMKIECEMTRDCESAVTHIGDKGYVYCTEHAEDRRAAGVERTRKMRPWEQRWIRSGRPLPSYKPGPKPKKSDPTDTTKET